MCWICAVDKSQLAKNYWGEVAYASLHFGSAAAAGWADSLGLGSDALSFGSGTPNLTDAFPVDGVGDAKPVTVNAGLILIGDDIADDTSTTATIEVDGAHIISTINTVGDWDFVKVELEAGHI